MLNDSRPSFALNFYDIGYRSILVYGYLLKLIFTCSDDMTFDLLSFFKNFLNLITSLV